MNLLIDTHSFLWFVWLDAKLSTAAHALMADPNNKLYLSPASFWEVAIKVSLKKRDLGEPFDVFVPREWRELRVSPFFYKRHPRCRFYCRLPYSVLFDPTAAWAVWVG